MFESNKVKQSKYRKQYLIILKANAYQHFKDFSKILVNDFNGSG